MSSYKPPAGPPSSVGVLAKYVLAYARASNLAEGRVRAWISYMITGGMLERATAGLARVKQFTERILSSNEIANGNLR